MNYRKGILSRIFPRTGVKEEIRALSDKFSTIQSYLNSNQRLIDIIGGASATGINVNEKTSEKLGAVFSCLRLLSHSVAQLPFGVYMKEGNSRYRDNDHPVDALLRKPSSYLNSFFFRMSLTWMAAQHGAGYALILRDEKARPREIKIIANPAHVEPVLLDGQLFYKIQGADIPFPEWDIFRIMWATSDGVTPKSPLRVAAEMFGSGLAMQHYTNSLYKSGATKKVGLKHQSVLNDEVKKAMRESWNKKHAGPDNLHEIVFLEAGMEPYEFGLNPSELQFLDGRKFNRSEIAGFYGVPEDMIGGEIEGNFNTEQRGINFVTYTLMPWFKIWENECQQKLFYESEQENYYVKFNANALMRGDSVTRMNYAHKRFMMGSITPNEIREKEDENPLNTKYADSTFVQMQLVPVEMAGMKYTKENNNNSNTDSDEK